MKLPLMWTHKINDQGTWDRRWWTKNIYAPVWVAWFKWTVRMNGRRAREAK